MTIPDYLPMLRNGTGREPKEGGCLVQVASFLGRGEWTDDLDDCGVHPALRATAIWVNDAVDEENLAKLTPYAAMIADTADRTVSDAHSQLLESMRARGRAIGSGLGCCCVECRPVDWSKSRIRAELVEWFDLYVALFLDLTEHEPMQVDEAKWREVKDMMTCSAGA